MWLETVSRPDLLICVLKVSRLEDCTFQVKLSFALGEMCLSEFATFQEFTHN